MRYENQHLVGEVASEVLVRVIKKHDVSSFPIRDQVTGTRMNNHPDVPLDPCILCPRQCGVNRLAGSAGYCRTGAGLSIASITLHRGEEPVISGRNGICNVFFSHCNLHCVYCQNHQISRNNSVINENDLTVGAVIAALIPLFDQGIRHLGFVSPSHMVPHMVEIVHAVHKQGYRPVVVYNSNGYDRVETLRELEDWVDVYLPDCKYSDSLLAKKYSGAADYPEVALAALREMYRQKGNILHLDDDGLAVRGLIVRHLVLPGSVANSLGVLESLAAHLSPKITLSLMAQYQPTAAVAAMPPLHRHVLPHEYQQVAEEMERLGFANGWMQEFSSARCYNPDFDRKSPFDQ